MAVESGSKTFLWTDVIVFPQIANEQPLKQVIAQLTNPIDIQIVLPERTAPSQIIASIERYFGLVHHESASFCFLENCLNLIIVIISASGKCLQKIGSGRRSVFLGRIFIDTLHCFLPVEKLDFNSPALYLFHF